MNTIRASDTERDEVARILQEAAGAGRLSTEEAGERVAQAQTARFREELAALISDLPEGSGFRQLPALYPPAQRRASAWFAWRLLRAGALALLFVGALGLIGLRWLLFPFFFPVWPLAFLFFGTMVLRRRWMWRRRYWGRGQPYWNATRYEF
ncbi:MAG TPA: DUF1707 domain-containing protein [Gemmatimonadales bacterium]|nr:DUF1707 domain-containing protein [Gemmatimonadales bacterium]